MITKHRRCGYTLIEIISVMGIFSLLMSISVAWIIQTMRYDSAVRARLNDHKMLLLLDRQLRDDIQRGHSMVMDDNQLAIDLGNDQSATYSLNNNRMVYLQSSGRLETYRFLDSSSARWETSQMPVSIGLVVQRTKAENHDSAVDLYVRGAIRSNPTLRAIEPTLPAIEEDRP